MSDQIQKGKDGTPAWAYDEDGYCVCCDAGRWKYHMPDCELRDALGAMAIVRVIASLNEDDNELWVDGDIFQGRSCRYCDTAEGMDHDRTCEWRRARELMEPEDGAPHGE